ncbi:hypothetical protein C8Q76DRAFT_278303 [Earliella scabrosa]|nr:hypothetical protein C8Q76DRAFT_278303 [Earliella scabrosa]
MGETVRRRHGQRRRRVGRGHARRPCRGGWVRRGQEMGAEEWRSLLLLYIQYPRHRPALNDPHFHIGRARPSLYPRAANPRRPIQSAFSHPLSFRPLCHPRPSLLYCPRRPPRAPDALAPLHCCVHARRDRSVSCTSHGMHQGIILVLSAPCHRPGRISGRTVTPRAHPPRMRGGRIPDSSSGRDCSSLRRGRSASKSLSFASSRPAPSCLLPKWTRARTGDEAR